ncbi:unnamed protein product [Arctogadus glacialis]
MCVFGVDALLRVIQESSPHPAVLERRAIQRQHYLQSHQEVCLKLERRIIAFDDVELLYGAGCWRRGHAGSPMSHGSASFLCTVGSSMERGGTGREARLYTEP